MNDDILFYKGVLAIVTLYGIFFLTIKRKGGSLKYYLKIENTIWFYTLFKWKQPKADININDFSIHRNSNYFWYFLALLHEQVIEGGVLHFFLREEMKSAVWFISAIHLYSVMYIAGEFNAIRNNRVKVKNDRIHFQVGVRRQVDVLYEEIEKIVRLGSFSEFRDEKGTFHCTAVPIILSKGFAVSDSANVHIKLKKPVMGSGLYGLTKEYNQISVVLDEPDRFIEMVEKGLKCA